MNGLIFVGCSFTWGQGLYFYSNLPRLIQCDDPHYWDSTWLSQAQIHYKNACRFPRLVANYFETFEIAVSENGGNNDTSLEFIIKILNSSRYIDKDLSYVIFQITRVTRDDHAELSFAELQSKYSNLDLTVDDALYKITLENIEIILRRCENRGIKPLILTWPSDIVPYIEQNKWFKDRLITFNYENQNFTSLEDLMNSDDKFTINTDRENLKKFYNDRHPSKSCHRVIADNIIEKIKNDNL